jgi:hypothetical protein
LPKLLPNITLTAGLLVVHLVFCASKNRIVHIPGAVLLGDIGIEKTGSPAARIEKVALVELLEIEIPVAEIG